MKVSGNAISCLLDYSFRDVECDDDARSVLVDYPLIFGPDIDMSGHLVVVPPNAKPCATPLMRDTICICTSPAVAKRVRKGGLPVITVETDLSFESFFNLVQTQFAKFERWDASLRTSVETFAGFQRLLDLCSSMLGCPCAFIDSQYRVVYRVGAPGDLEMDSEASFDDAATHSGTGAESPGNATSQEIVSPEAVDLLMASPIYQLLRSGRKAFHVPNSNDLIMRNLFSGGKLVGALVIRDTDIPGNGSYARFVQEHTARAAELMYARIGSFGAAMVQPSMLRSALKLGLEDELENVASLDRMLTADGHGRSARYVLMRIDRHFTNEDAEEYGYFAHRLELDLPGSYCVVAHEAVYALVDVVRYGQLTGHDFWRDIPVHLRELLVKAGISRVFSTMDQLTCSRVQAGAALEQGSASDPTYWSYRFDDYALAWILEHGVSGVAIEYVAHPSIAALRRYDAVNGTDLVQTLAVFVKCRYNATAAAKELYVARSTLLNRLEKINEIAPVDFDNMDARVYLGLSIVLLER